MKRQKNATPTKSAKQEREKKVLLGLIEYYLMTGQPVGSSTLKDAGFGDISSATIRNYFAELEKQEFLTQLHTSGGRIPTEKAFRLYAEEYRDFTGVRKDESPILERLRKSDSKEIASYLQYAAESLSELTNCAVFLSAPRFDHDFVVDLKLVPVDYHRFLCVMITDFGVIQTELMHSDQKLSSFTIKRIEGYFHYRLTGVDKPENLNEEEEELAKKYYTEVMLRYIVGYSTFIEEEIYRTGFSRLLSYSDFHDTSALASSLSLFENTKSMRLLLKDSASHETLKYWIGEDLAAFAADKQNCAVVSVPYKINKQTVGAIGILGPLRMPYKEFFGLLKGFGDSVSEALTRNLYKFKISFRKPEEEIVFLQKEERGLIGQSRLMLLEDKT